MDTSDQNTSVNDDKKNQADVMLNLETLVKSHLTSIDQIRDALKKQKEMYDDIFLNDPTFQEHDKIVKEAAKVRKTTQSEIMKRANVYDIYQKMKDLKIELKDKKLALSEYVREYQRLSGVNEIVNDAGEVMEIVYEVKLIRKPKIVR